MNPDRLGLIEMVFTIVVVLGGAGALWWANQRSIRRDRAAASRTARHPVGEHEADRARVEPGE